ncbi:LPS export ABC transporter permease LptF [Basilea psittacipulmonis]|uniref:Lipopolysaccharide export system permease protein LptF n=1 Tax=Basilea psittacipulmonis DSM 24701 TaxID=1072685 RepID=A0A077DHJ4_9BURK|nr:LPS export ABC transporter permease LptF [Basilea psittacipulmonis]AIL33032.1 permease [Basilea psittacipulmonis DSM 24701]
MSLFKRSVSNEIISHTSMVFCTLTIIWISVLLVRLLGQATQGAIGADLVFALSSLAVIAAVPTLLTLSLFLGVIMTISRNYRDHEMMVWFSSGVSTIDFIKPTLRVTLPLFILITLLTLFATPWSQQQISEYRVRFQNRSEISKVALGQFIEVSGGDKVVFIEPPKNSTDDMGQVFARIHSPGWYSIILSKNARILTNDAGERLVQLGEGTRYDTQADTAEFRTIAFDQYTIRVSNPDAAEQQNQVNNVIQNQIKARPSLLLFNDHHARSDAELFYRLSIPIAAIILSFLAIPLGAVNPRIGKSGALIIAGLLALIYMNVINLARSWISSGSLSYVLALVLVHGAIALCTIYFFWLRIRVKAPKPPVNIEA